MVSGAADLLVVRPDQVTLGVLISQVPLDAVDDAIEVCGVREKRPDGKLPAHVTAYLTLALSVFADDDYEEVAVKVTGSLDKFGVWDAGWTAPTASAVTQARKRLGRDVFAGLFASTCGPVAGRAGPAAALAASRRGRSDRAGRDLARRLVLRRRQDGAGSLSAVDNSGATLFGSGTPVMGDSATPAGECGDGVGSFRAGDALPPDSGGSLLRRV